MLLRILILLMGALGMSIGGWVFLCSLVPAEITISGFIFGYVEKADRSKNRNDSCNSENLPVDLWSRAAVEQTSRIGSHHATVDHYCHHHLDFQPAVLVAIRSQCDCYQTNSEDERG